MQKFPKDWSLDVNGNGVQMKTAFFKKVDAAYIATFLKARLSAVIEAS